MKLFLIVLALGFASPDKLDRAYLPPPGAPLAGGSPGDILAPPEITDVPHEDVKFGIDGLRKQRPIGQSTVVPITTTSYAFTQTTTYPPIENYETTAINPITGVPVQIIRKPGQEYSQSYPIYSQNQGQNIPQFEKTNQQVSSPKTSLSGDKSIGAPSYDQFGNKLQDQYTNQYPESPGVKNVENTFNSDYRLRQQGLIPSHPSTQVPSMQYDEAGSETTPAGPIYSRPLLSIQENDQNNFVPRNKNPAGDLNHIITEAFSRRPNPYSDGTFSTTTPPNNPSSSLQYSSFAPIKRLERPQAEADRNAVIINYENVRTPTGYFYSYDTSNGMHADENGSVGDGTRAQGSYSYIGDDGKNYSVIYTADENGFQPHGEHLPTPPPVPEAIQRVIEQAIRDKEAGIVDDGTYDEERYGYKKYVLPKVHRIPQIKKITAQDSFLDDFQSKQIRPISKITEEEDDDALLGSPDIVAVSGKTKVGPIYKQESAYPFKTADEYGNIIPGDMKQILNGIKYYSPLTELENGKDLEKLKPNPETNYKFYKDYKPKHPDTQRTDIGSLDKPEASFNNYQDQAVRNKIPELYGQKSLTQSNIGNLQTQNQEENQQVDKDGYQYNPPEVQFQQTGFPSRFKVHDSMKPNNDRSSEKQTTRRPFLTPEVYNQPSYKNDEEYQQSNTRKPFATSEVDGRENTTYNRYDDDDDGNDSVPEQEISNNNNGGSTFNFPKTYALEKETVRPSYEISTFIPKNSPVTTSSRFNSKVTSQRTYPISDYGSTYSTGSEPVTSEKYPESQKTSYKYQPETATVTTSETYPNEYQPAYASRIPYEQKIVTPGSYYASSTDLPVTSTALSGTPKFTTTSRTSIPTVTFENLPIGVFHTRNHYGTMEPNYYGTVTPKQPISMYTPTYNSDYQQSTSEPAFISSTTRRPDKSGTFILSGSDANVPKLLPTESYQSRDQYGPTNPTYTTIKPSLQGAIKGSDFKNIRPKTPNFKKPALGYIYDPPSVSTPAVSSIGTTPGYVSSTTGRPFYSPPEDSDQSLVDGFGRPIYVQQPDYPYFDPNDDKNQGTDFIGAKKSIRPNQSLDINDFPGRDQTPDYEKYKYQPNVIGEDFRGPKQPQRFDPETGYHY